ncbi:tyrosine-type recombinase/integrase [Gordonia sp. YY1]|uniref:tyrosine-type recombinase/integrase n=1 Tax=Gordonia sp. YY1 TaxID=396712 RepID=UPI0013312A6D|nr:site-specific integrase [Gordonia sp. YY1]KAF0967836.1 putative prophage phiRv2 integrase [Gordonia sp. YY1]
MATKRTRRAFGGLRKLPSGRWQANYTGPDGALHKAPSTFETKLDAEAWLADRRREIDRDLWNPLNADRPVVPLFGDYADEWLDTRTVRGRPLKTRTRDHYRELLDKHLVPEFGDSPLDGITPAMVRQWHAHLLPTKATMRAHAYSLMRTIMGSAVSAEYIDANPCRVEGAGSAQRKSRTTPATVEELMTIVENMPERLRLMVQFAAWCALRYGELIELRRSDIDLAQGTVSVTRAAIRRADGQYVVTTPKSEAGVRVVHMPPHLIPLATAHLEQHVGRGRDALLFEAGNGGYLTPTSLYRWYYPARRAAGRDDLRFHDLRHTGAVLAALTGATLAELQQRLGHSTVSAAMKYQHAAKGRDRKIAEALSLLVAPDTPKQ